MNSSFPFPQLTLDEAAAAVRRGDLVIYPTETFFAIGGDAFNPKAVAAVYAAKQRPATYPLPVIVASAQEVSRVAQHVSPVTERLMAQFWPGPLTIIFPARTGMVPLLSTETGTIAVRQSSHRAAQALGIASASVLISSSANKSGIMPVSCVQDLDASLASHVAGVLDMGSAPEGGLASTIVSITTGRTGEVLCLRRSGAISARQLQEAGFSLLTED